MAGVMRSESVRSGAQAAATILAVVLWLGMVPVYIQLVAPYVSYLSASAMAVGLAISSGLACHLWPTRTPPWRTVALTALLSAMTGSVMLILGAGRVALTVATLVGFGFVALRANQNGRRLWRLVQTWRALR